MAKINRAKRHVDIPARISPETSILIDEIDCTIANLSNSYRKAAKRKERLAFFGKIVLAAKVLSILEEDAEYCMS